jgi:hypothetical protein
MTIQLYLSTHCIVFHPHHMRYLPTCLFPTKRVLCKPVKEVNVAILYAYHRPFAAAERAFAVHHLRIVESGNPEVFSILMALWSRGQAWSGLWGVP